MIKLISGVVAAMGVVMPAHAVWDAVIPSGASTLEYVTGGVNVSNGPGTGSMFLGRNFSAPASGATRAAAALATEQLAIGVGGNQLAVTAVRVISMEALAGSVLALGAAAYVGVQAGAVINSFLGAGEVTIGPTRCTPTLSGWQCDAGQAARSADQVRWKCTSSCTAVTPEPGYTTAGAALDYEALQRTNSAGTCPSGGKPQYTSGGLVLEQTNWYTGTLNYKNCNGVVTQTTVTIRGSSVRVTDCPAYIDALNPAWSGPDGGQPGPDGKCKSGRYNAEGAPFVKDRLTTYADPTMGWRLAQDIMDKGGTISGVLPQSITGPASKPGTPTSTTTTNPDGTTTTTTKTPTTNYTYSPTSITYNTTTTTVTNNGGNVTTTTTNDVPQQTDQCKLDPTLVSCMKAGEPPNDPVTPQHKDIAFATEDLGFGGACPAPYNIAFRGWQFVLNYQPACNAAPLIRPGLIALTALSCLVMVVTVCGKP